MEPEAKRMLESNPDLKLEFEEKMQDLRFANDAGKIMQWFYSKTPYIDHQYLIYPVARILN